jgi:CheY-like chemotaxis protein
MENMLRRLIGEDIELTLLLAPNLGSVKADPTQLEQVVLNLVINARDAMPAGGRLTIATESAVLDEDYARLRFGVAAGPYAMLVVSDSGQGMSKSVQEHVFEPFFTTKEIGKGTGLGLATVFGIVKQSGGHIALYSEPGQGTTFKVYFPRTEESPDREVHSPLHPMDLLGTETILLVEDEDAVRQFVCKALTRQGYTVLVASNGEQASAIAEQHRGPIHLLLTDVVMPNMSGRLLADRLLPRHPGTRVIYMSGYTEDTIVRQGVLGDGADFLSKPLTLAAMLRKVRDVLDRPKAG